MTDIKSLGLKIKEVFTYDQGASLQISYNNKTGGQNHLAASFNRDAEIDKKIHEYLNFKDIEVDLSGVKNKEDAEKFKTEYMEKHPVPEKLEEHLAEHQKLVAEKERRFDFEATIYSIVTSNNPSQETYDYMRELFRKKAEGEKIEPLKEPLLHTLGIKRDPVFSEKKRILADFNSANPSQEQCSLIYKALPTEKFKSKKEADTFEEELAYDPEMGLTAKREAIREQAWDDCWRDKKISEEEYSRIVHNNLSGRNMMNHRINEASKALIPDLIDLKIRERVEKQLDVLIDKHMRPIEVRKKIEEDKLAKNIKETVKRGNPKKLDKLLKNPLINSGKEMS